MRIITNSIVAVVLSVVVVLCLQSLFQRTRKPKEIWFTYVIGLLSAILAVVLIFIAFAIIDSWESLNFNISNPVLYSIFGALFISAIPEITFKILVLLGIIKFCAHKVTFERLMDGLVYGGIASLGFAVLQNIMVFNGGFCVTVSGVLIILPLNIMLGAIMGYHLVKSTSDEIRRYKQIAIAWAIPVVLYALFNFPNYLIIGITRSGSNIWLPMYVLLKALSFSSVLIAFVLAKKYLYCAREEQKEQIFENGTDASANTFTNNERFM